ncbi:Iron-binding zinc finger CDGSH type [uncultured archaeon]|nr:Iron-binding zinc finger CDGSH type [uncultured archaeon]
MARVVRFEDQGPREVKVGGANVRICMCGLSKTRPFCDNSHIKTLDEDSGKTYSYDGDKRTEVTGF